MSTLAATNLKHASSASNNIVLDSSGNATFAGTAVPASSFLRNRIINGDMRIDQRNAGAAVTISSYGYGLDRWGYQCSGGGAWSSQRSAVAPAGFPNSLILTVTTADASIGSTDVYQLFQKIEGFNASDFGFGTASAQTITVSFWVRSSVTGTYSASFQNASFNRGYVATFTVNVADTFEYKTITIPGDTSGTWDTTNGIGLQLAIDLGSGSASNITAGSWQSVSTSSLRTSGSVNWIANAGATFFLTGVQLEVGTAATPFERRQYGQELLLCQRYYEANVNTAVSSNLGCAIGFSGSVTAGSTYYSPVNYLVQKRAVPTVTLYNANLSSFPSASVIIITGTTSFLMGGVANGTNTQGFYFYDFAASAEL